MQIQSNSTGNKTLTAVYTPITYTITYELDGGTNDDSNPTSYTIESSTITLKDATKADSEFAGWTLDGVAVTEIPTGSSGDKTITANWGDIAPEMSSTTYSLTAYKGQPARLAFSALGSNISWNLEGALPAGLAFSGEGNSAEISGTPELGTSGTYSVRVVAANDGGTASADVVITVASDFAQSGDVETGEPQTVITDSGASSTTTSTTFKNGAGDIILAAEIAITTEADELVAVSGEAFAATVNVDVSLDVRDTDYKEYAYSLEIIDIPDWLNAEGEMSSSGELKSSYHHEFTLSGMPLTSRDAEKITMLASVTIAGDEPALDAYGSKEVFARVSAEKIDVDVSPDVSPDQSPDITPQPDTPSSSSDVTPQPDTPSSSSDVTPQSEPVVIENGKITINNTGTSGGSSVSIADIIANMTDEEKQSITQIEINSDVSNTDWMQELPNLKVVTIAPEVEVEELDLSGNTSITELNTQGSHVKSINLAGCINVVSVDCAGCGAEKIDTTGCVSLSDAGIAGNSLSKFDAEELPSLKNLDCGGQTITADTIGEEFSLGGTASASAAFVMRSAFVPDRVKNLEAFDAAGNEIAAEYDAATETIHFAKAPAKVTYDYDTGFNGVMMDVTISATEESEESESAGISGSSGGCNSIFGITGLFAGLFILLRKRR